MAKSRWLFIHPFQLRLHRGIEVYLWNLTLALTRANIDVDILTWDGPLELPEYIRSSAVRLLRIPAVPYFQEIFAVPFYLYYLLKGRYSHTFVHFAGYGEGPALRLARLIRRIDFSVVFHFPPSLVPHRYREFDRWGFGRNAAHLISVSQATAREVNTWAGRVSTVIGHGVDTQRFKPDHELRVKVRGQFEINPQSFILISAAALEERKGMQWMIQAMPRVLAEKPNTLYIILGEGTYRRDLEEMIRISGLHASVRLLGFQRDIAPYLAASDVALLLSRGEASPVSLLECAAAGLPVITSLHEPFPELVQPDWGEMVSEDDLEKLSHTILSLQSNIKLRTAKGLRAREYVTQHHQWNQVAWQYQALIETKR
jgi:glycosyltransferase involved in cell wall biosynthesis